MRKVALVVTLAVVGIAYLGWLPKEKAERFVRFMVGLFVLGFVWRVGAWLLSLSAAGQNSSV